MLSNVFQGSTLIIIITTIIVASYTALSEKEVIFHAFDFETSDLKFEVSKSRI